MNVIMHYPSSKGDIQTLQRKVSTIHAETIIKYLDKSSCSKEQKTKLIDDIIDIYSQNVSD